MRNSSSQSAILRNNAFYVEPATSPSAIVVAYKDRTSQSPALPSAADEANALKQLHSQQAKATPSKPRSRVARAKPARPETPYAGPDIGT